MPDNDTKLMMPRPPSWMSTMMTAWPKGVQYVPVSSNTSPVRETAKVAVKSAGRNGVHCGTLAEIGSIKSTVPTRMSRIKPAAVSRAGPKK